jgi:hypothetical protein
VGRTARALGADGPRALEFYLIYEVFGKSSRENFFRADSPRVFGGWSEINLESDRTVHSSGGPGRRSTTYSRTVRKALADSLQGPGGQSARPNGQL